jgi:uncharacterized membrane protein
MKMPFEVKFTERGKRALLVSILIALTTSAIVYAALNAQPTDQFLQLYLLSEERTVGNYYPHNNTNLDLNTNITWYVGVHNLMAKTEYIALRVKLSNQTDAYRTDSCNAVPRPVIWEYTTILAHDETFETKIMWSITNIVAMNRSTQVDIQVNNSPVEAAAQAINGLNFMMVFEVWTLHTVDKEFTFSWTTQAQTRCARTHMWFNVTNHSLATPL